MLARLPPSTRPSLTRALRIQSFSFSVESRVQDPSRAAEIRTGHLWVYRGEMGEVVYDFTWSRNRDGPLKMLANYRGYLQVDAAPAYDDVFAQSPAIVEVGCWEVGRAHV